MLGIIAIIIAIVAVVVSRQKPIPPSADLEKIKEAILSEIEASTDKPISRDEVETRLSHEESERNFAIENLRMELLAAIDASNQNELHIEG